MGETILFGEHFEWDEEKATVNAAIHEGVTFEEAVTAFDDRFLILTFDVAPSDQEDRYHGIGIGNRNRTLVVTYTIREPRIRIISARKAEPHERKQYGNAKKGAR